MYRLVLLLAVIVEYVAAHGGTSNYTVDGVDYRGYACLNPILGGI